jgi:hypothetical protein
MALHLLRVHVHLDICRLHSAEILSRERGCVDSLAMKLRCGIPLDISEGKIFLLVRYLLTCLKRFETF